MALFDFLKSKEKQGLENKLVGRYQQLCLVKQMLGEEVSSMEKQIAANKDSAEMNEIVDPLEKLSSEIKSEDFINQFDVADAHKRITKLMQKGYKTCVLQNNSNIEDICLTILEDTIEFTKSFLKKERGLTDEQIDEQIPDFNEQVSLFGMMAWAAWPQLGGLIKTDDEQHAWMIIASLIAPKKQFGRFKEGDSIGLYLGTLPLKKVNDFANYLRTMKNRMMENKYMSEEEGQTIDAMIENGLAENKKTHEEYPDRP